MREYYLAVDIGASGGRHVLGYEKKGQLVTEEIYRFDNYMDEVGNRRIWNVDRLFREIVIGMKKCNNAIGTIRSMAIDTWGVDYVLLDDEGRALFPAYAYRDLRTENTRKRVEGIISRDELYERTGIQDQPFNTLYQLIEHKESDSEIYNRASHMVLIPDYLTYLLTGDIHTEYTNATTTGLVSIKTGDWDYELIDRLQLKRSLFSDIVKPGTCAGRLKEEIVKEVGFDTLVMRTASHDTASAVVAVPTVSDKFVYISSGTWSLMGTELDTPIICPEAGKCNYTNEGGVQNTYRFLKNIFGMWFIQCLKHEYDDEYSYSRMAEMAKTVTRPVESLDVNDPRFLSPKSVKEVIDTVCEECGMEKPANIGEYASVIFQSLADYYLKTLNEMERLTGVKYDAIHVIGGGSQVEFLDMLMAMRSKRKVYAGPVEATAIGNIIVQMIADGIFSDVAQARKVLKESTNIKVFGY
ncbi:MAG: rhamnulokinase [Lachnospiraceae bacterium]|nr:rhamnulokinase [Lachnospiraceae bacterium]